MNCYNRIVTGLSMTACLFLTALTANETQNSAQIDSKGDLSQDEIKKISTALGHYLGRNLTTPGINFDIDSVIQGMRDGSSGKPASMSDTDFETKMAQLQKRAHDKQAEANLNAANEFLVKNAKEAN